MPSRYKSTQCSASGCIKKAQSRGLCKGHGGGSRCHVASCEKLAQSRGLCVRHGGGRRCSVEGCAKLSQYRGLCLVHGGGRRCSVQDCQKFRQIRDKCKAHSKVKVALATEPPVPSEGDASKQECGVSKYSSNVAVGLIESTHGLASPEPSPPTNYSRMLTIATSFDPMEFGCSVEAPIQHAPEPRAQPSRFAATHDWAMYTRRRMPLSPLYSSAGEASVSQWVSKLMQKSFL